MTMSRLDEAIKHAEEIADYDCYNEKQLKRASDYRQLAEWLRELKELREQTRWIPVTERLPEEYVHVLCQFALGDMTECYWAHGVFHIVGGKLIAYSDVIAWRPLPQPYVYEAESGE